MRAEDCGYLIAREGDALVFYDRGTHAAFRWMIGLGIPGLVLTLAGATVGPVLAAQGEWVAAMVSMGMGAAGVAMLVALGRHRRRAHQRPLEDTRIATLSPEALRLANREAHPRDAVRFSVRMALTDSSRGFMRNITLHFPGGRLKVFTSGSGERLAEARALLERALPKGHT